MTIHRLALGERATSITTFAALLIVAGLAVAPTAADAAGRRPAQELAQGAGMGAKPSIQVRELQLALKHRDYDLGRPGVDGRFGPLTAAAVMRMQADHALPVDGIVGDHTRRALGLTRHAVDTQRRSRAEHGSKITRERRPTTRRAAPRHATAAVTTVSNTPTELSDRDGSWLRSFLAGALAGLITALLAVAFAARRRRRDRERWTTTLSLPPLADEIDPRSDDRETALLASYDGQAGVSANGASSDGFDPCLAPGHRVIGYVTLPADPGVVDDDGSLEAIKAKCERCGWDLLNIVRDREVGPTLERPGLGYALERIANRQADGLVVSHLQRLSRSIVDLGALMGWFREADATLIALDLGIDTSTRRGRHVATTLITLSNHAHERIARRNGIGLTEVNAGPRAGRPAVRHDPGLLRRIAAMRAANMTLQAIADELNAEGVPTLRGGKKWRPSSIQAALGYRRPGSRDHLPALDERERAYVTARVPNTRPPAVTQTVPNVQRRPRKIGEDAR